ncbi:MAG: SDR family NAD(P)-dependent oxidoreductase [Gammaproteobacteria bacterium]
MDLGIAGHVAIVTGAGNGIGKATARVLAQEGCRVAVLDKDPAAANAVAAQLAAQGADAFAVEADVASRASMSAAIDAVLGRFGRLEILVNNAGFSRDRPFLEMTDADWDAVMDVCLKGVFICTQLALPAMLDRGYGRVVNIASRAHLGGEPNKTNYSAAKGGVVSFTKALSLEVGRRGVTVNAVAPGFTRTERLLSLPHFTDIEARAKASIHVDRGGEPEDMARTVAFLAAADSGFITGEVVYVTGGRYG